MIRNGNGVNNTTSILTMTNIKLPDYNCPDAILTADWHLRLDNPECRTDNIWTTLKNKINFIWEILNELETRHGYTPPILFAGDLFNRFNPTIELVNLTLRCIPELIGTPGNHDLPAHRIEGLNRSGIGLLNWAEKILLFDEIATISRKEWNFRVTGFPFDSPLAPCTDVSNKKSVAIIHQFVYHGRKPFPGATGGAHAIMKKLEGYDLILSGDNHQPFTYKNKEGQLIVNPGSLSRQTAAQIDHKPRIYLWYADVNEAVPVYIPIDTNAVSRKHIEIVKERESRIEAFVQRLTTNTSLAEELNFEHSMRTFLRENEVSRAVKTIILNAMGR